MKTGIIKTAVAATAALALSAAVQAQVHYSTSFEAPTYTLGSPIGGLDGWVNGSGATTNNTIGLVDNTHASHGSQSYRYEATSAFQSFYSMRREVGNPWTNSTDLRVWSVDLYLDQSTQANRLYGLYLTSGATSTLGGTNLGLTVSGDGSIRAGTTWAMTYQNTGLLDNVGAANVLGRWLTITLAWDPVSGMASAQVSGLGGGTSTVGNSWATAGTYLGVNIGTDYFATTDRLGTAWFDNYQMVQVPGPAALTILGLGLAGMSRRRRQ